jgi:hypothetical protein
MTGHLLTYFLYKFLYRFLFLHPRLEDLMVMKMSMWSPVLCHRIVLKLYPDHGDDTFLRITGNHLPDYTVFQPRRLQQNSFPPILQNI